MGKVAEREEFPGRRSQEARLRAIELQLNAISNRLGIERSFISTAESTPQQSKADEEKLEQTAAFVTQDFVVPASTTKDAPVPLEQTFYGLAPLSLPTGSAFGFTRSDILNLPAITNASPLIIFLHVDGKRLWFTNTTGSPITVTVLFITKPEAKVE